MSTPSILNTGQSPGWTPRDVNLVPGFFDPGDPLQLPQLKDSESRKSRNSSIIRGLPLEDEVLRRALIKESNMQSDRREEQARIGVLDSHRSSNLGSARGLGNLNSGRGSNAGSLSNMSSARGPGSNISSARTSNSGSILSLRDEHNRRKLVTHSRLGERALSREERRLFLNAPVIVRPPKYVPTMVKKYDKGITDARIVSIG